MYLIHYPKSFDYGDQDPMNKTLRIATWNDLWECKNAGKIRSVGVSSFEIRHLEELKDLGKVWVTGSKLFSKIQHFCRTFLHVAIKLNIIHTSRVKNSKIIANQKESFFK